LIPKTRARLSVLRAIPFAALVRDRYRAESDKVPGDHLPQRVSDYAKWLSDQPERRVAVGDQHDGVADDALTERNKPDVPEPERIPRASAAWDLGDGREAGGDRARPSIESSRPGRFASRGGTRSTSRKNRPSFHPYAHSVNTGVTFAGWFGWELIFLGGALVLAGSILAAVDAASSR
jgi:hypothetical protein